MANPAAPVECQFQEYVPGVNCAVDCKDACQGVQAFLAIKRRERAAQTALNNKTNPPLPSNTERERHNDKIAATNTTGDIQYRGERVRDSN